MAGVNRVTKQLADGTYRVYEYDRKPKAKRTTSRPPRRAWPSFQKMPNFREFLAYYESKQIAARNQKIPFMSEEEFASLVIRSGGKCELTGVPFQFDNGYRRGRNPFNVSMDRIVPGGPYSYGNTRLVLQIVNVAMADWGEEVFRDVCLSYVQHMARSAPMQEAKIRRPNPVNDDAGAIPHPTEEP